MNLTVKDQKELDVLKKHQDKIRLNFCLHKIKTLHDYLKALGHDDKWIVSTYFPSELSEVLSGERINELLTDKYLAKKVELWLAHNPPKNEWSIHDPEASTIMVSDSILEMANDLTIVKDKEDEPDDVNDDSDYGIPTYTTQKAILIPKQKKAAADLIKGIKDVLTGRMLLGSAGIGKTFILGQVIKVLVEEQWAKKVVGSLAPWPIIYVTKASIVKKTERDLKEQFGLRIGRDVLVINIDQLRSKAGELWINEKIKMVKGEEVFYYEWRPLINPCLVIWDECQVLKNPGSAQHKIGSALNDLDAKVFQIFASATPGHKVSEMKCFAVATRHVNSLGSIEAAPLSNETWNSFARNVASPAEPDDNNEAAMGRLRDVLDKYIVQVKGVRSQFRARNSVCMINFETVEDEAYYNKAIERFELKKSKLESKLMSGDISQSTYNINKLTAMLQYRIAAESNPGRIRYMATQMFNDVLNGKAAVCAVNFKVTICKMVEYLVKTLGVKRDMISIIWGGDPSKVTDKQKAKAAISKNEDLMAALAAQGITFEDLQLDDVEAKEEAEELDPELGLGPQSIEERQRNIDRFQSGKALFCFYTFRAGGVGLSLHHSDDLTKEKVRKKKSGYAYREDIAKIPTRQRVTYVAPTWSAIELVQGLGRAPRLTSLSDTIQRLVFFKGTIEERVARIVGKKLRCLGKFNQLKEDWHDVANDASLVESYISNTEDSESDSDQLLNDNTGEEE